MDPNRLVDAFVEAWNNGTSHCGRLKIACREVTKDSATFLLTDGEEVVSQLPIAVEALKNKGYLKDQTKYFPVSVQK